VDSSIRATPRPPDELESSRLVLRRHKLEHAPALFKCIDEDRARLCVYLPWVDVTHSVLDVAIYITMTHDRWATGELFDYAIFSKHDDRFLGVVEAHEISWRESRCEIGYWILGRFEGQGYISEALEVLEPALFKLGLHRLEIRCSPANERSAKVPRRNGYRLEPGSSLHSSLHTSSESQTSDALVFVKNKPKNA
jgi:ribosomal-protein-serine acetyltransferase